LEDSKYLTDQVGLDPKLYKLFYTISSLNDENLYNKQEIDDKLTDIFDSMHTTCDERCFINNNTASEYLRDASFNPFENNL